MVSGSQHKTFRDDDGTEHRVSYRFTRTGVSLPDDPAVTVDSVNTHEVVLAEWVATAFVISRHGDQVYVDSARLSRADGGARFPEPGSVVEKGSLLAPMPGAVIRLGAALGDAVAAGQPWSGWRP